MIFLGNNQKAKGKYYNTDMQYTDNIDNNLYNKLIIKNME